MMLLAAITVTVLLAAVEWLRAGPRRLLRTLLAAAAGLALGMLGVRPVVDRPLRSGTAIVLAAATRDGTIGGASGAAARRLADSLGGAPVVLRDTIPGLAWLRREAGLFDTLHVVGGGLDPADRRAAAGLTVLVHGPAPAGLIEAGWTRSVALGGPVIVSGRIASPATGDSVWLDAVGGAVDSAAVSTGGAFTLRAVPRAAGRRQYLLRTRATRRAGGDTLGISVSEPRLPRVLIVEGAPAFETRHLKTWLAGRGGSVAVRSLVGLGTYRYEYFNRAELSLGRLTARTLAEFDVVVTDAATLAGLASAERSALRTAVADSGLGVLLLADAAARPAGAPEPFFRVAEATRAGPTRRDARVSLAATTLSPVASPTVPVAGLTIDVPVGGRVLARDDEGRAIAAVARRGSGAVGVTLVTEPGRWLLGGHREAFEGYWTLLLEELAAGAAAPAWEVTAPGPLLVNDAVELLLTNRDPGDAGPSGGIVHLPDGSADTIATTSDRLDPGRRRAVYWPRVAGWHRIEGGGAALEFHVASAGSWAAVHSTGRVTATRRDAIRLAASGPAAGAQAARPQPLPLLPFLLLLVGATGMLWAMDTTRRRS